MFNIVGELHSTGSSCLAAAWFLALSWSMSTCPSEHVWKHFQQSLKAPTNQASQVRHCNWVVVFDTSVMPPIDVPKSCTSILKLCVHKHRGFTTGPCSSATRKRLAFYSASAKEWAHTCSKHSLDKLHLVTCTGGAGPVKLLMLCLPLS